MANQEASYDEALHVSLRLGMSSGWLVREGMAEVLSELEEGVDKMELVLEHRALPQDNPEQRNMPEWLTNAKDHTKAALEIADRQYLPAETMAHLISSALEGKLEGSDVRDEVLAAVGIVPGLVQAVASAIQEAHDTLNDKNKPLKPSSPTSKYRNLKETMDEGAERASDTEEEIDTLNEAVNRLCAEQKMPRIYRDE